MDFLLRPRVGGFEPNVDVFVDEDRGIILVSMELAGVEAASLQVGLRDRCLIVAGRRRDQAPASLGSFTQKEIAYGDFVREVALPSEVLADEAEAAYDNGMLLARLPIAPVAYAPTARAHIHLIVKRIHV
ncbi:MAG: Hsp20/alpha crystallin family protein [Vulcanimicrobiaceae bacterium]